MALQYHRPRKQDLLLGGGQVVAEDVVHVPEKKTGQEHEDALPAGRALVGGTLTKHQGYRKGVVQTSQRQRVHAAHVALTLGRFSLAQLRPQVFFHDVEAAEDGGGSEEAVRNLVEDRVLGNEVVDLNKGISASRYRKGYR